MRKTFLSWTLALVALVFVSIPQAQAGRVINVSTYNELVTAFCTGQDPASPSVYITKQDTIRMTADITFSLGIDATYYLFVADGTTRTLDLNGYTLKHIVANTSPYSRIITMYDNSTLNIYDSRGTGQMINDCRARFSLHTNPEHFDSWSFGINSACITNDFDSRDHIPAMNCVVNIYGGKLIAQNYGNQDNECSAIQGHPKIVPNVMLPSENLSTSLLYAGGGHVESSNMTVNLYGGSVNILYSKTFTIKTYVESLETLTELKNSMTYGQWTSYVPETVNVQYAGYPMNINLFGGSIGTEMMAIPALTCPQEFSGTLQEGTIYGISSEDNLNNFQGVSDAVAVYLNGTKTTVNALKNQDLSDKTVRFEYAPEISVANIAVTRDNCDDILSWEEYKVSFDYATNTLYLKSLGTNTINTINGNIVFDDFPLNIVVDGKWKLNGRIVGHDGNLVISAAHPQVMVEEDADLLSIEANSTPISLNGKHFTAKHRVRVVINAQNTAVSCGMFAINNAWFDAWGKKPMVDCQNSMIQNATIKTGSLKDNDVVQIEPNIQRYVLFLMRNIDAAGTVCCDGYYPEGTEVSISATANSGYHFLRWDDGVTDNPRTVTMTQDIVLTAIFEADVVIPTYTVNVVSADETMGTVSGGGTDIPEGTVINITATPNSGYEFLYWTTANGQVQGKQETWMVTRDETLTAHFRAIPDPNDYLMWVCGTQVSTTNAADILGDGVWCYDHDSRTLTTMKDATYNLTLKDFVQDWITDAGPLTMVVNHNITVTTDDTEASSISMGALLATKGLTIHIAKNKRLDLTAKNMYAVNIGAVLTIDGHGRVDVSLQNTNDKAKTAMLLSGTPALTVDGAWMFVNVPTGCKVSNKTDDNLSVLNGEASGSMSGTWLEISDQTPRYSVNMTPSYNMDLCVYQGAGDYFEGEIVTLRALPATGYKFVAWSDGNTDNPRTFTMPAHDIYLDPIVTEDTEIGQKGAIINANATEGQGSITGFTSGWYAEGTELTITAVPAEGYEFVEWSDGKTDNPYHLTVVDKQNVSITACFAPIKEGIDQIVNRQSSNRKFIKDGIIYIIRPDGKVYNALGAEIK